MSKLLEKDGKFFRTRRGKLVEIPLEWVGNHYPRKRIKKEDWNREDLVLEEHQLSLKELREFIQEEQANHHPGLTLEDD